MASSDLSVCNRAIGRIGGDRIDALNEDSPLGVFCAENYAAKRRFCLSKHRWTFAGRIAPLAKVDPPAGSAQVLRHAFAKPADLVGAVHAWRDHPDPLRGRSVYVMEADGLYWSDTAPIYAEFTRAVPEAEWPAWFEELVVTAFAAELADFAQLSGKARDFRTEAWGVPSENGDGGLYLSARQEDARLAPPRRLVAGVDAGPLVGVRRSSPDFTWDGTFIDPPSS